MRHFHITKQMYWKPTVNVDKVRVTCTCADILSAVDI